MHYRSKHKLLSTNLKTAVCFEDDPFLSSILVITIVSVDAIAAIIMYLL